jgi:hypothetical protein
LSKENVEVFDFWLGIDSWADIFAWIFVSVRYIGLIMIIVGCLISGPGKNNGWNRFVRYVSFIYGTTYFLFNFNVYTKDDTTGLAATSLLSDRSNFTKLYAEYFSKSADYLFSFERFDLFKDITGKKGSVTVDIVEWYDGQFYELAIYGIFTILSLVTLGGLKKGSGFAQKMSSLRFSLSLGLGPGLLGKALQS